MASMMRQFDLYPREDAMRSKAEHPVCWTLDHIDAAPSELFANAVLAKIAHSALRALHARDGAGLVDFGGEAR
jgi:hypothetical protein